jgi:integrase
MGVKVREKDKGSGVWWVFVNQDGRRRAHRVGDKKAANSVASELRHRIGAGEFRLITRGRSFEALAKEWLVQMPALRGIRLSTQENYRSFTTRHLLPYFGRLTVDSITAETITGFITAKLAPNGSAEGKLARPSLRTGLVVLRLILQKAVRARELDRNPMDELDRLPQQEAEQSVDPFTTEELGALVAAAQAIDPTAGALFRLWAQTGLRAGELSGLQWGDLDLERGTLTVQRTFSRGRLGPTKTGRWRTVSMLHPVADPVADWRPGATPESRSILTALRRLPVRPLDPAAFLFGANGAPITSGVLHRLWSRVVAKARVRYRVAEQLRHSFASTMLSRNAPLLYVQEAGGWRTASVMLRVYSRWMPGVDFTRAGNVAQPHPAATPAQPELEGQEERIALSHSRH